MTQPSGIRPASAAVRPSVPAPSAAPRAPAAPLSTAPTNPLPTNPLPLFVDHATSGATTATAASTSPAVAPSFDHQFYVKQGESVRTLSADQIRLEVASGIVGPGALVCKVGDTVWRTLADAAAIGLDLPTPPALPSPNLPPAKAPPAALMDEPNPFARPGPGAFFSRLGSSKNKGTLIVWGLSLSVAATIVLWRSGTFYSVASKVGFSDTYESLEKSMFGGPGEGTARSAERLLGEIVPADSLPFSAVDARVTGPGKGNAKPAP